MTCPFLRYHPAIIAQGAATVQDIGQGRFTLGLGAGENLSEHVVGRGWPAVDVRHEMLAEAITIIRSLWTGEWTTFRGQHLTGEDAKLHTLPETAPPIAVAASGARSVALDHAHHFAFGATGWTVIAGDDPAPLTPEARLSRPSPGAARSRRRWS